MRVHRTDTTTLRVYGISHNELTLETLSAVLAEHDLSPDTPFQVSYTPKCERINSVTFTSR